MFSLLNGKPASLVAWVEGQPVPAPAPRTAPRWAPRSPGCTWRRQATARASPTVAVRPGGGRPRAPSAPSSTPAQNDLLAGELKFLTGFGRVRMPRGAIHGDLFCDNVLFVDERVSGIIDFGFAATDFLAYDLAITVNDWCIAREGADAGALVPGLVAALVGAYDEVRPLTADERAQWPALVRAAALRFWLSRLYDLHLPRPGETRARARSVAFRTHPARPRPPSRTPPVPAAPGSPIGREAVSAAPPAIAYARHPARRGVLWLKQAAAEMLAAARVQWLMLLLFYYILQLLVDVVPVVGPLAMMVLRPVFTVGFLAAAWTQERGGVPEMRHLFRGFRSNLWALVPIGIVLVAGTTLAVLATALVDGGVLLETVTGGAKPDEAPRQTGGWRPRCCSRSSARCPRSSRCGSLRRSSCSRTAAAQGATREPARRAGKLARGRCLRPDAVLLRRRAARSRDRPHRVPRAAGRGAVGGRADGRSLRIPVRRRADHL